jgi:hypothetical protein
MLTLITLTLLILIPLYCHAIIFIIIDYYWLDITPLTFILLLIITPLITPLFSLIIFIEPLLPLRH